MNRKQQAFPDQEAGIVNGWRYLIRRSEGGSMFWVVRRSLSPADHGRREEPLGIWETLGEAKEAARKHMERCAKGVEASCGCPASVLYTNK